MKFLLYTLGDDSKPTPPQTPEQFAEIGKLIEDATKAGILLATGGLAPSATGTRVISSNGQITVTDGPFAEAKELVGGWALIEVGSKEEAIEWAKRFRSVEGDGVSYIRRVYGPDDGPGGPA